MGGKRGWGKNNGRRALNQVQQHSFRIDQLGYNSAADHARLQIRTQQFRGLKLSPTLNCYVNLTPNQSIWTAYHAPSGLPPNRGGPELNSHVIPPGTPANPTRSRTVVAVFVSLSSLRRPSRIRTWISAVQAAKKISRSTSQLLPTIIQSSHAEAGAPLCEEALHRPYIVIPFVAGNKMSGGTYGFELFCGLEIIPSGGVCSSTIFRSDLHKNANSQESDSRHSNGSNPRPPMYLEVLSIDCQSKFEARHDSSIL